MAKSKYRTYTYKTLAHTTVKYSVPVRCTSCLYWSYGKYCTYYADTGKRRPKNDPCSAYVRSTAKQRKEKAAEALRRDMISNPDEYARICAIIARNGVWF